jgi:hypothetical protein
MGPSAVTLLTAACLFAGPGLRPNEWPSPPPSEAAHPIPPPKGAIGYLWFYNPDNKGGVVKHSEPYFPREGDLIFFDDQVPVHGPRHRHVLALH